MRHGSEGWVLVEYDYEYKGRDEYGQPWTASRFQYYNTNTRESRTVFRHQR